MSNKLKLNVKNVILGCHNFGDILATNRIHSKIPRLIAPSAIDHTKSTKPDLYYKQDYLRRNALNSTEAILPRALDSVSLKRITSKIPIINKRICEIHTGRYTNPGGRRISNPGGVLPWESPIGIVKKNLQNPLPGPEIHKDGCEPHAPLCAPTVKGPKYPTKLKCYPRKLKKTNLTKITPCILNNCRFYSANRYQPSASLNPFKPKFCKIKRYLRCGAKPCKPTTKKSGCSPSIDSPGGDPCAGILKAPKECYQTPGKGARSGGFKKGGPVCPDNPCGK